MRIAGLVLAAGEGRRLGRPKALVELDGERLVDRAVRVLHEGGCDRVLVVAGAAPLEVDGAEVVHNADWPTGMGSSLRAGLAALPADADAVVVSLVDQPGIGREVVARLIAAAYGDARIAVATYDGAPRNPVLLTRDTWSEAAAVATGDVGARGFLAAAGGSVTAVECGDVGRPDDIDTMAALEAWSARGSPAS